MKVQVWKEVEGQHLDAPEELRSSDLDELYPGVLMGLADKLTYLWGTVKNRTATRRLKRQALSS